MPVYNLKRYTVCTITGMQENGARPSRDLALRPSQLALFLKKIKSFVMKVSQQIRFFIAVTILSMYLGGLLAVSLYQSHG